jgi:hypothetical protein
LATILTIARIGRQLPARIKKRSRAERSSGNSEKEPMRNQPTYSRRSMLVATTSTFALFAMGVVKSVFGQSTSPTLQSAVEAYIYFYPLVVFGVSFEVLTNVQKPTWERLSAPVNQFMSVRQNRPDNHGVILPSTDTLYTMAWVDVTKEPIVFGAPKIPNIPGNGRKRFMMYEFMDAWTNVYYSDGLQKGRTGKTNFVIVGPDFKGALPEIADVVVVKATANQSWLMIRTQVEGFDDLDNVHAIQDKYSLTPISMHGKNYMAPDGVVNPSILSSPGPSPQVNAMNGKQFFLKASEWFNKVPFSDADKATSIREVIAQFGVKHGQKFDYDALSDEQKQALDAGVTGVQAQFAKVAADPSSGREYFLSAVAGPLKNGWTIPPAAVGQYGTDYKFRAVMAFVGFGAGLRADGMYILLVQDGGGKVLDGRKKYTLTFAKGQLPPAGAFWSVTMYQDQFLVPNIANKYSVSEWMNPKFNDDGSLTIYMQPTSPGAHKEINWLPSSASIPTPTPLMRLYWPLAPALDGAWSPPPVVEVK